MQPTFNPWIGYFDLIDYVDKFIFLDTVQLNQQSWQTRNKLKAQNQELLFSIPTQKDKSRSDLLIKDAILDFREYDFRKKLLKTLERNYKKSLFFNKIHDFISELILYETDYLSQYNINMITKIAEQLNIDTTIVTLSETNYSANDKKGDLILGICNSFKTTSYISPLGSKEYLSKVATNFSSNNIQIEYQYYNHPVYRQLGTNFIPYIGIFDLLYNEGFENSLNIIRNGRKYENR